MSMNNYRIAIKKIFENGLDVEDPIEISEDDILNLERRFGHLLPESYKQMLRDFGSLEFEATEIYGLTAGGLDDDGIPNVVFATESRPWTHNGAGVA